MAKISKQGFDGDWVPVPEGELYIGWLECRICGSRHADVWSVDLAPWEEDSQECPVCGHKACGVSDDQSCDEP